MPKIIPCKHGLPISKCRICFKEHRRGYRQEYHQRPEVKQRIKEHMKAYYQRPEVKQRMKEHTKAYYQRPEVKQRIREYRHQYYQRPEVKQRIKEHMKAYYQRPEVKEHIKESYKEYSIIQYLIEKYTKDLNNLNAQIKREWIIPPIPIQGKQVELQNLIDNLRIIKEYTTSLPRTMREQARRRMLNELLSTEGRLVSWRKPLPRDSDRSQNVNTSMKKE